MKKYNNYKKYYESHKEQEIQRYLAYYYANRERILAERKEKRKNAPKKVKLTANDFKDLWYKLFEWCKGQDPYVCFVMRELAVDRLEKKKEMLKDE